ncbi:MAG: TlpA family protein disulfide reductase [Deltaproteobacteria bacterium]|nr:TlpA family protein disulfide reductase [Deltaproteobacteria bacterium]
MKGIPISVATIVISLALLHCLAFGSKLPPEKGGVLPEIKIPVPVNAADRSYLDLKSGGFFKIPQIKAKAVIIEIFSMYCPHCQREAPEINRLYNIIDGNPDLKDKIKLIGIGAGNSSFEVGVFKKKYNIPFPLFPDEDFSIHKGIGEVRTPYFLGVKINDDGTHRIFYSQLGKFKGAEPFLELMLQVSGLKQEK